MIGSIFIVADVIKWWEDTQVSIRTELVTIQIGRKSGQGDRRFESDYRGRVGSAEDDGGGNKDS
jgi:hypothetical protein